MIELSPRLFLYLSWLVNKSNPNYNQHNLNIIDPIPAKMERAMMYSHYYLNKKPNILKRQKAVLANIENAAIGVNGLIDHTLRSGRRESRDCLLAETTRGPERRRDVGYKHSETIGHT